MLLIIVNNNKIARFPTPLSHRLRFETLWPTFETLNFYHHTDTCMMKADIHTFKKNQEFNMIWIIMNNKVRFPGPLSHELNFRAYFCWVRRSNKQLNFSSIMHNNQKKEGCILIGIDEYPSSSVPYRKNVHSITLTY